MKEPLTTKGILLGFALLLIALASTVLVQTLRTLRIAESPPAEVASEQP